MLEIVTWASDLYSIEAQIRRTHYANADCLSWKPEARNHPDEYLALAESQVTYAAKNPDELLVVGTLDVVMFNALRLAIRRVGYADAHLHYWKDSDTMEDIPIDAEGRLESWPCFNAYADILRELL